MRIASRLRLYLDTICMPGEFSARPLFVRGIYFTSAMTEGAALDLDLADAFGVRTADLPAQMRVFGKDKSYFLKDFFLDKCFPEGGLVTMPLEKTFWAPKYGMLQDRFGVFP